MSYRAFVGCYTLPGQADPFEEALGGVPHDRSKVSDGIHELIVSMDGKLSHVSPSSSAAVATIGNPSYLCLSPAVSPRYLYAVSELEESTVSAFEIIKQQSERVAGDGVSLQLKPRCVLSTDGSNAAHVCEWVIPDGGSKRDEGVLSHRRILLVSNYGSEKNPGSVALYDIHSEDFSLTHLQTVKHYGSSADPMRQTCAHAHCAVPQGDVVYVTDLGTDSIVSYKLSSGEGGDSRGIVKETSRITVQSGSGPRSFAINPAKKSISVVTLEMVAEIQLIKLLPDGALEVIRKSYSLVPRDWPETGGNDVAQFNGGKWASDVLWSPDGNFVYAAARLHNSISVFRLDNENYALELVQRISSGGVTPRSLCISPCGKLLLVAHMHSHSVVSFRISTQQEDAGSLTLVDQAEVPLAACIKLMKMSSI